MGYYYSTYYFFGVHVPREQYEGRTRWEETDRLDQVIATAGWSGSGVGHISAGNYDNDELFLRVMPKGERFQVVPGRFAVAGIDQTSDSMRDAAAWSGLIRKVAAAAGYDLEALGTIGWYTVPDFS